MKNISDKIRTGLAVICIAALSSCRVDTLKEIKNLEPTVSLVQVTGGQLKLIPDEVEVDKENMLVSRTLGISYAGFNANDAFTATVQLSLDDVPDGYEKFSPGECFVNTGKETNTTTIEIPAGENNTALFFNVTKAAIDAHAAKKVAAKLKLTGISKYTLNTEADSVYLLMDMNDFGSLKTEVTAVYFKNASFARAAGTTDRFAKLADWTTNDAVMKSRPQGAGFDANVNKFGIERWGSYDSPILNGKIYQAFTLPKGNYEVDVQMGSVATDRDTYLVAAAGTDLPDDTQIGTAIGSQAITADFNGKTLPLLFTNPSDQQVSIGFLLNFDQGVQKVLQASNIKMYKIESLFD